MIGERLGLSVVMLGAGLLLVLSSPLSLFAQGEKLMLPKGCYKYNIEPGWKGDAQGIELKDDGDDLIDGDKRTTSYTTHCVGWKSGSAEVTFDLGKEEKIGSVVVYYGGRFQKLEVSLSKDGQNFTLAGQTTNIASTYPQEGRLAISGEGENAKYIKIKFDGMKQTQITEVEIYAGEGFKQPQEVQKGAKLTIKSYTLNPAPGGPGGGRESEYKDDGNDLIDGDKRTTSHSANLIGWNAKRGQVVLDLGAPQKVSLVKVYYGETPTSIIAAISPDGDQFSKVAEVANSTRAYPEPLCIDLAVGNKKARYLKLILTGAPMGYQFTEVEVYGTGASIGESKGREVNLPQPTFPSEGKMLKNPLTFQWKPLKRAKSYILQYSSDETFLAPDKITTIRNIEGTRYKLPTNLSGGTWFWQVRASGGHYSPTASFVITMPDTLFKTEDTTPQIKPLPKVPTATSQGISKVEIKDRYILLNGQPFFPIGLYCYSHLSLQREISEAGFNTILSHNSYTKEQLDSLLANGLRVVMDLFRDTGMKKEDVPESFRGKLLRGSLKYKDHPAVLAYWIDEPDNWEREKLATVNRITKEIDPHHPTTWCLCSYRSFATNRIFSTCDIISVDPYPMYPAIHQHPFTHVSDRIELAKKEQMLVWDIPQAFDQSVAQTGKTKEGEYRPNPVELHCLTYLPIIHGASAILYWASDSGKCDISKWPREWAALKKIAGELSTLTPVLLSAPCQQDMRVESSYDSVHWLLKKYAGRNYILAANVSDKPVQASFYLGKEKNKVRVLFENRAASVKDSFTDTFIAHGVHVYEIE